MFFLFTDSFHSSCLVCTIESQISIALFLSVLRHILNFAYDELILDFCVIYFQVIDEFLKQAVEILSPCGCIYLLLSDDNHPEEVHELVSELSEGRLHSKTILRRRAHNESLGIYRYTGI